MRFAVRVALPLVLTAILPVPGHGQSGSFGTSVLVGDGELIIAEPTTYFRPGTVYVYRKSDGAWREAARLRAPEAERADGFGTVLARAGGTLFIGQRAGPVHTFERDGDGWRATGTLAGTDSIGIRPPEEPGQIPPGCNQYGYCETDFGITLAADGDWLLIGEPGVAPERRGPGGHQAPESGRTSGEAGVVHAFRREADGTWHAAGRIRPADGTAGDRFGAALSLSGGRALIGAPGAAAADGPDDVRAGRVYQFTLDGGTWSERAVLQGDPERDSEFGHAVSLGDGVAVVGAPGAGNGRGAVFLYHRDARGEWARTARLTASDGEQGDRFGSAVALDGGHVWVGVPAPRGTATGSVHVYRTGPGEPVASASQRIRLTETVTRDAFGDRIVAAGGVAAVTATGMDHGAGAVYVYERDPEGAWGEGLRLASPPDALAELTGEERRCEEGRIGPFDCDDIDLLAFVPISMLRAPEHARGVRTNDNWGWTDPETGREYALVGRNDGTSFVDITDPATPVLVGDLPKTRDTPPSQLWRDIKTYADHAFIVADGAGDHGMQVFDLRRLRDVTDPPALFEPDALYTEVASVHNIVINEETGFAYIVGARGGGETCGGGLHMADIRDPLNPRFVGCFRDERTGTGAGGYTHDAQCTIYSGPDDRYHGREICLGANVNMLSIADVTDKENPVPVSRATYPNPGYLHQGWLSEDHRYYYMDDEADVIQGGAPTTRTMIWDLSDLEDPVLAAESMGSLPASAHNLYIRGDTMYQANYRYGLHILDISDPLNPREVGSFDTTPYLSGPGFSGAWSNYPFFESGTIIVTSLQEGLFVLRKRPVVPPVSALPSAAQPRGNPPPGR